MLAHGPSRASRAELARSVRVLPVSLRVPSGCSRSADFLVFQRNRILCGKTNDFRWFCTFEIYAFWGPGHGGAPDLGDRVMEERRSPSGYWLVGTT